MRVSELLPSLKWQRAIQPATWLIIDCSKRAITRRLLGGFVAFLPKALKVFISVRAEGESLLSLPEAASPTEARDVLLHLIHQDPHDYGVERSRWRLQDIKQNVEWLRHYSVAGVWEWLHRAGIHWKRAQAHVHSPDDEYLPKLLYILQRLEQAQHDPKSYPILFEDEFTFSRRPILASAYETKGDVQPRAEQGYDRDRTWRIAAALNIWNGEVHFIDRSEIGVGTMVGFYKHVCELHDHAKTIFVVQDNGSIHHHPDVLAALEPQEFPFRLHRPASWGEEPSKRAKRLNLPIQLLPLPTYASWCNPIEKLWRMLRQELLHLHRFRDNWIGLRESVRKWLENLLDRSQEVLRYCGVADPNRLYAGIKLARLPT
jgi:transposase